MNQYSDILRNEESDFNISRSERENKSTEEGKNSKNEIEESYDSSFHSQHNQKPLDRLGNILNQSVLDDLPFYPNKKTAR